MDSKRSNEQSKVRTQSKTSFNLTNEAHSNDLKTFETETNTQTLAKSNDYNQENNEYFYNFLYNNLLLNQIGSVPLPFALPPSSSSSLLSSFDSVDCAAPNLHKKPFQSSTPSSFSNALFQSAPHYKTSKSNFQIDNILNNKNSLGNWNSHSLTTSLLEEFNRHQLKTRMQQEQE